MRESTKGTFNNSISITNWESNVLGPGVVYLDTALFDVYLVSSRNRNQIIGRPVFHFVIDEFSRMITGIHVELSQPTSNGVALAIANCAEDKVQFCEKFGIEVGPSQWEVMHLPSVVRLDRGMFLTNPKNLTETLGISIENIPNCHPRLKGVVDRVFRSVQSTLKNKLPGVNKQLDPISGKGNDLLRTTKEPIITSILNENSTYKNACLTLEQFTKTIILGVLHYNNHHYLKGYRRLPEMIESDVKPIPSVLWGWGIKNGLGHLIYASQELVNRCLKFR